MKTEIDSFPPQEAPATWALTELPQEGHHSYPLSPWMQNGMTQWQGCLRALTESSKAHGSAGQPSSKVHGTEGTSTMQWEMGNSSTAGTPVYFIWTTLRRKLWQLRGLARGKLLTNNEDSDTSHHPVVLGFSLSLSVCLYPFLCVCLCLSVSFSVCVSVSVFLSLSLSLSLT